VEGARPCPDFGLSPHHITTAENMSGIATIQLHCKRRAKQFAIRFGWATPMVS